MSLYGSGYNCNDFGFVTGVLRLGSRSFAGWFFRFGQQVGIFGGKFSHGVSQGYLNQQEYEYKPYAQNGNYQGIDKDFHQFASLFSLK